VEARGSQVTGPTADRAAARSAVDHAFDRVVQLSNGEYEVHNIGVNWPHHIFVNQDFTVVGAD
jgi:hypothetical protein